MASWLSGSGKCLKGRPCLGLANDESRFVCSPLEVAHGGFGGSCVFPVGPLSPAIPLTQIVAMDSETWH